jgi:hypothetical protein
MILVDSSVWIDHFRKADPRLEALLIRELVSLHSFVLGELACGNLTNRSAALSKLRLLPTASRANVEDVHHLLESRRLWGRGLGWIDLHLLTSALIDRCRLWTNDRALGSVAASLGIGFE